MKLKFIKLLLLISGSIFYAPVLLAQDYCTPVYSTGCTSGDNIDDVYLYGATTDIINESTPCSTGGYTDYTDMSADLVIGVEYTGSVSTSYSGAYEYVRIWIDYDEDGEFESTEVIAHFGPIGGSTPSEEFTVNVPAGTSPGDKRMRVRLGYGSSYSSTMDPCTSISWGECHDYTITVIEPEPCEDVDLVAGTLADMMTCPSVPFTLYNDGSSIASGLERIWQSSPEGTGTWTTIIGAEGYNLLSDGITEATDYRCIVTCTASGASDTTNVATVSISSFLDCYCIPTTTYTSNNYITFAETTLGGLNFSNTSTAYATSAGYSDFTGTDTVSQVQGASVDFEVNTYPSGSNCNLSIWVDWNQDGIFGDDEEVYTYLTSTGAKIFTGTIEVPMSAEPGPTRMRIRSVYYYSSWYTYGEVDPCDLVNYGEAEDYIFNVIEAIPCEELELIAGTIEGFEICPEVPFNIINSGTTLGSGIERIWQSSPEGTGEWTTVASGTDINYSDDDGITEPTDYRCIVICTESGAADTTNIATVSISPFFDCYCIPSYSSGCTYGSRINGFSTEEAVVNISNLETGCASGAAGYTDYSEEHEVSAVQFSTISQTTEIGSYSGGVKIWVDWNQNGIYGDETNELVAASTGTIAAGSSFTSTFMIPLEAIPGETRMRVRVVESSTSFDPCASYSWGETEDYTFNVIEATPCSDTSIVFPESANAVSSPFAVCGTGDVTLSVDSMMPLALGITYKWQMSSTGTGGWTDISEESMYDDYFYEDVSEDTYFRCVILCEGEVVMYTNPVEVESVVPTEPVLFEGQTCGPGPVTLTGEVESGEIFWFETETGGTPFAMGDTIETPSIETTTTFYASGGAFPPAEIQIGTGTSSTTGMGPFYQCYRRTVVQMMYTVEQLEEQGAMAGLFDEVRFYMQNEITYDFPDYTVSIKMVPASMTTLTWQTDGFTEVFGGTGFTFSPTESGWQSFPFDAPLNWDGASNIVVKVCWSQMDDYDCSAVGGHRYTTTPGQMLGNYTDAAGTSCTATGTTTSSNLPHAIFNFLGCTSDRIPVVAHVRDTPYVQIDVEDGEYCLFNNLFEIPTSPNQPEGTTYLWNTGDTDSFITVTGTGVPTQYWVEVTNEWGCTNSDTVNLTLKPSPEVDLGPDTLVCEGGTVPLDAGDDGVDYYWNTGDTTRTIVVDDGGNYAVLVTNEFGCMATDTILVTVEGYAPTIDGIIVDNLSPTTFQFTPFHPLNVISYEWTFGDGSDPPYKYDEDPVHTYADPGTYMVTLEVASSCGKVEYFTYATIVQGIDEYELSKNNLKLYPNPTDNLITVETIGDVKMNQIKVINMLGQEVMTRQLNDQTSVVLDVSRLASGMYQVQIESNKGLLVKKFQVVR